MRLKLNLKWGDSNRDEAGRFSRESRRNPISQVRTGYIIYYMYSRETISFFFIFTSRIKLLQIFIVLKLYVPGLHDFFY